MAWRKIDWVQLEKKDMQKKNIVQVVTYSNAKKITIFMNGTKTKTEDIAKHV